MLFPLIILFTIVPLVEIYFLFQVGEVIGGMNTILLVAVTGILGAYLARSQGRLIMNQVQRDLAKGGVPADSLLQGLLVFIGGILLVTPGIMTDVVGFCFVFPATRWIFLKTIKAHFAKAVSQGRYRFHNMQYPQGGARPGAGPGGFHVYTQTWSSSESTTRDVVEVSAEEIKGQAGPNSKES